MCAHDAQAGNMTMLNSIGGILLHLRKHVSYDARVVIGRLLRARDIDGDVGELWPGEGMVEVIFHEITGMPLAFNSRGREWS